jgi:hypothetical protein
LAPLELSAASLTVRRRSSWRTAKPPAGGEPAERVRYPGGQARHVVEGEHMAVARRDEHGAIHAAPALRPPRTLAMRSAFISGPRDYFRGRILL